MAFFCLLVCLLRHGALVRSCPKYYETLNKTLLNSPDILYVGWLTTAKLSFGCMYIYIHICWILLCPLRIVFVVVACTRVNRHVLHEATHIFRYTMYNFVSQWANITRDCLLSVQVTTGGKKSWNITLTLFSKYRYRLNTMQYNTLKCRKIIFHSRGIHFCWIFAGFFFLSI